MSRTSSFSLSYISRVVRCAKQCVVKKIGPAVLLEKYYDSQTGEAIMRVTCRLPGAAAGLPVNPTEEFQK